MTREKMMDNIIKAYGMESKEALYFCDLVERHPFKTDGLVEVEYFQLALNAGLIK